MIGLSRNPRLEGTVEPVLEQTRRQFEENEEKQREFGEFRYQAKTWKYSRRVVAKVEVNEVGINRRFVVTNRADLSPRPLYDHYSDRGQTENYIKAFKIHLKMDRLSCHRFWANQFRLLLHALAYQMFLILRDYLYATPWQNLEVETLRRRILKIGARVRQTAHLDPLSAFPEQGIRSSGADFTPLSCPARTENTIPELSPGMLCPENPVFHFPTADLSRAHFPTASNRILRGKSRFSQALFSALVNDSG